MKQFIKVKTDCGEAKMYRGFTQYEAPKSYKKVGTLYHNIGNDYSPHTMRIHKAKDGTLRYEIYRDGNFYPYFGRFEFIKQTKEL